MARWKADGRTQVRELEALLEKPDDGPMELRAPGVGLWRGAPRPGALVTAGSPVGELEVLGVRYRLMAPAGTHGVVLEGEGPRLARRPVGFGDVLLALDPEAVVGAMGEAAAAENAGATGLVFRAPSSGRFYARPAPDKPAFVQAGDTIGAGHAVALLEVMKTFNRIPYGGAGLPDPARVVRVLPDDGADVEEGDPLLEVEPA